MEEAYDSTGSVADGSTGLDSQLKGYQFKGSRFTGSQFMDFLQILNS